MLSNEEIQIDIDGTDSGGDAVSASASTTKATKLPRAKATKTAAAKPAKAPPKKKASAKRPAAPAADGSNTEDGIADAAGGAKKKKKKAAAAAGKVKLLEYPTDPQEIASLALAHPTPKPPAPIPSSINAAHPLRLHPTADIRDRGHIMSIVLSPDGTILATFSTLGTVRLWDTETWALLTVLRDEAEESIDEFLCGAFTPDMTRIVVGGKLKDPKRWSEADNDNHILPCPLKVFDIMSGNVVERLEGHEEEILCVKLVSFCNKNYFVTTSQDGYIIKWQIGPDWRGMQSRVTFKDGETCMAFAVSFLPHTGNRYLIAACDSGLTVFDFELETKIQHFSTLYSCYCDCALVVDLVDFPSSPLWTADATGTVDGDDDDAAVFAYVVSRGVEEVEAVDGENVAINTIPNTVAIHKLSYPATKGAPFVLTEVKRLTHDQYRSNSWLIKIASNGRHVLAPTYDGGVVVFNAKTGQATGVLRDHDSVEVRDALFSPEGWTATCGDDGMVKVYLQDQAA
ncbi:hypothetical protein HDU87_005846 [Geranomyces variabilis]|uniref:WD40 repeat-like protein n=1 Tax=Geranomyces variabilis TaxID=109894 RepID=A0AAD5THQ8_9FUNG|nr:hypothetical protein HDU87_005846 [Geranomyces variabilis]